MIIGICFRITRNPGIYIKSEVSWTYFQPLDPHWLGICLCFRPNYDRFAMTLWISVCGGLEHCSWISCCFSGSVFDHKASLTIFFYIDLDHWLSTSLSVSNFGSQRESNLSLWTKNVKLMIISKYSKSPSSYPVVLIQLNNWLLVLLLIKLNIFFSSHNTSNVLIVSQQIVMDLFHKQIIRSIIIAKLKQLLLFHFLLCLIFLY